MCRVSHTILLVLFPSFCKKYTSAFEIWQNQYSGNFFQYKEESSDVHKNIVETMTSLKVYHQLANSTREELQTIVMNRLGFTETSVLKRYCTCCKLCLLHLFRQELYVNKHANMSFISLDMRKANFNTLKTLHPDIVLGAHTYAEFVKKFCSIPFLENAKKFRARTLGKIIPARTAAMERFIMALAWKQFETVLPGTAATIKFNLP